MIKTPAFTLLYNNKSATADIAKDLIEAVFTDHLTGEADELDILLADPDRKWLGGWYPTKGATLQFAIGYDNEPLLDCGTFAIDEITITDSPNTVQIRALSASVNDKLRTIKHKGYDNQTLDQVIKAIAKELGYTVEGKIQALQIERLTQQESDLAFIKRLADTYGYLVKVSGKRLIFSKLSALNNAKSIATIDRSQIFKGWRFTDQIRTVPKKSSVTKHNPKTKQTIKATANNDKTNDKTTPKKSTSTAKSKAKKQPKPLIVYGVQNGKVTQVN